MNSLTAVYRFRRLQKALGRWGWPGWAGLLCIGVSLFTALLWLPAQQREFKSLRDAADLAQRRAARRLAPSQPSVVRPASKDFLDAFAAAPARHERVAALLASATQHGLEPRRVEFRLSHDTSLALARYSVTTPVVGSYASLRAFIEEAQARDPMLSLDRLRLRRASVTAAAVEAELSWSLYMLADPSQAAFKLAASREKLR